MRPGLFLLLISFSTCVRAQVSGELYHFPTGGVPSAYRVDAAADHARMAEEVHGEASERDRDRFAEMTAYSKQRLMISGGVYFDPPLAEAYLNSLAARLNKGPRPVRIYLARDAAFNAFAIHDGSLFVNVGLLAEMPNEAALAGIIGHEISHFINDDNRVGFFNKLELYSRRNRNSNYELRIDKAHEDRTMEHIADSMGALMARGAGYDLEWTIASFMLLLDPHMGAETDSNAVAVTSSGTATAIAANEALLADHPDTRDRIAFIRNWLGSDTAMRGGSAYVSGTAEFARTRRMARLEALNVLLQDHEYYACIERAFRYHLVEPVEKGYLYFLAEALRRYLYIMPDLATDGFLVAGYEKYFNKGEGVLHRLDFLMRDTALLRDIDTTAYWKDGKPVFETNDEALKHFLDKGDAAGITEVYLSKALFYRKYPDLRDTALARYERGGGTAKAFVEALRNNQLDKRLRKCKGELLLLDEVDFVEDHTYGYRQRFAYTETKGPRYTSTIASLVAKRFPAKEVVQISDMRQTDLDGYLTYSRVSGNLAIVEWMWAYEKERAIVRERLRGLGLLGRKKAKVTTRTTGDANADSTSAEEAQPVDIDPEKWKRRKRTKQDMKFYWIDPHYWEFLASRNYRTVEYMKVRSFDDQTRIVGNALGGVFFLYPGYWSRRVTSGSNRYAFHLSHVKFNTETQQTHQRDTEVNYRLTRPNLKSVVYNSLIDIGQ